MYTFATRNEGDVGCCLRVLEVLGAVDWWGERVNWPGEKNFKINLAGVENVSTFAVPTKTGKNKEAEGAMPVAVQDERFIRPGRTKYKPTREAKAQRSLKKCQLKYNE
ncbi:MAG: hypothetical protein Q7U83_06220 [Daejeonella sp.]|nr:hypothetical protein [Daejeonella sp.]